MRIPKRFKEALETQNEQVLIEKSTKISDKFKVLLKYQNKTSQSDQNDAPKRTNLPGRMRKYSDAKLLRILKAEAVRLGRTPTAVHFQNSKDLPNPITYQHRWESWNNAVIEAGLKPNFTLERKKVEQRRSTNLTEVVHKGQSAVSNFRKIELYASLSDQEADGVQAVQELGKHLSLGASAINEAKELHNRVITNGIHIGRTTSSIASATIYLACRKLKKPIPLSEIAQTAGISQKGLMRTARTIEKKLELSIPPLSPMDVIDRIADKLLLKDDVISSAKAILHNPITQRGSIGMSPFSVAAAAIYIAGLTCRSSITQDEIAKAANVTEVTIRNRYRKLAKKLGIDLRKYLPSHYIKT